MGTKWNGLNRNKKPRQISLKKLAKLEQEKGESNHVSFLSKFPPPEREKEDSEPHIKIPCISKNNGLKRNKKPRQISKKKLATIPQEKLIREKVKERANGHCEICGEFGATPPTYKMETHELVYRSALGAVSLSNSVSCDSTCHEILQRYRLLQKGQCIRMIIQARNVSPEKAYQIYDKIYEFAEKHGLIRESKLNAKEGL